MWLFQLIVVSLVIYLVTSLLFRYLIKSNKIKSSKVTRIFYTDDDTFISKWEENRKKGEVKYVLYHFIINSMAILGSSLLYVVVMRIDFNMFLFCGLLTGNIIGLFIKWDWSEDKYYKLLKS